MLWRNRVASVLLLFVASSGWAHLAHAELNDADVQQIQKLLAPQGESWRQIPWKISVLDAQRVAARNQKPIFIWAMDGHPLGCT